jgi:transcriptional repressor NrdR
MRCPFCRHPESKVIDSRLSREADVIRRRRRCLRCSGRFTTYERVEEALPVVVKKDGRREAYDRTKMVAGLKTACQKRPISVDAIDAAADRIERRLQDEG